MNAAAIEHIKMVEVLRPALDRITAQITGFTTFQQLTDAVGYRPTLRGGRGAAVLADNYDIVMERRGDPRRAQRG
jgi:hypothetical protein